MTRSMHSSLATALTHAIGPIARRAFCLMLGTVLVSAAGAGSSLAELARHVPAVPRAAAVAILPATDQFFIENRGQRPTDVVYYGAGSGNDIAFTGAGVRITTVEPMPSGVPSVLPPRSERAGMMKGLTLDGRFGLRAGQGASSSARRHTTTMSFVGARTDTHPVGRDLLPTLVSYFKGPRTNWHTGLATFGRVVYEDLWPGIDLEFAGTRTGVTYHFLVHPGADSSRIRVAWDGVEAPQATGPTSASTNGKTVDRVTADAPQVEIPWEPALIVGEPRADESHAGAPSAVRQTGSVFTAYAGYFGSAGTEDRALGIVTDAAGHAYVTGQIIEAGEDVPDAFIAKINLDGRALDYMTIIGGDNGDAGFDIDVDKAGNAYITGYAASDEFSFPVTVGPNLYQSGDVDILLAKLNPTGTDLIYAGFIGGELIEFGEGIRVDDAGNVYLHGIALSSDATFPVKVGPDLTFNRESDGFVCKVKAMPSATGVLDNLDYCGYIGGDAADIQMALEPGNSFYSSGHIALDAAGALYVSGMTTSSDTTFPGGDGFGDLPGPDQTQAGKWDAYGVKVKPDGSGLAYAGYVGGDGDDWGKGMTVDAQGNAYFTGYTSSTEATLPVKVGPDLTFNGGDLDGFVAKVMPDGSSFGYLGFFGGANTDDGEAAVVDGAGRLTLVGYTDSKADTFPAKVGPDLTLNDVEVGAGDGYVARIKANPSDPDPRANVDYAGYIGGAKNDQAFWVDIDGAGDAYVVGDTESDERSFPDGTGMAGRPSWDSTLGGTHDGFVVKVGTNGTSTPPQPTATPTTNRHLVFLPATLRSASLGGERAQSMSGGAIQGRADGAAGDGVVTNFAFDSDKSHERPIRMLAGPMRQTRSRPNPQPIWPNRLAATSPLRSLLASSDADQASTNRPQAHVLRNPDDPQGADALQLQTTSFDDFCDFGIGWVADDSATAEARIATDSRIRCYYMVKLLAPSSLFGSVSNGHRATGDFAAETVVDIRGKDTFAGLMLGASNDLRQWYGFIVSDTGDYLFAKSSNGAASALARGTATFDVTKPVKLMAAIQGSTVQLFVNDKQVDQFTDSGSHNGRVGVYTERGTEAGTVENDFDYIRISKILGGTD